MEEINKHTDVHEKKIGRISVHVCHTFLLADYKL